jgi:hypothetical protein
MKARDNPFCTDRVLRVRFKLPGMHWPQLMSRLAQLNYHAAIVGPHGSGKTTLLEDLEPRLIDCRFQLKRLRLDEDHRCFDRSFLNAFFANLSKRDLILFDGAEQMSRLAWRWFLFRARAAGGLIVTSHLTGLLPTLFECRTTPALLAEILDEVLEEDAQGIRAKAPELFRRHRGNLRDALRECYDICATR